MIVLHEKSEEVKNPTWLDNVFGWSIGGGGLFKILRKNY